jgi:hypothetical protein
MLTTILLQSKISHTSNPKTLNLEWRKAQSQLGGGLAQHASLRKNCTCPKAPLGCGFRLTAESKYVLTPPNNDLDRDPLCRGNGSLNW